MLTACNLHATQLPFNTLNESFCNNFIYIYKFCVQVFLVNFISATYFISDKCLLKKKCLYNDFFIYNTHKFFCHVLYFLLTFISDKCFIYLLKKKVLYIYTHIVLYCKFTCVAFWQTILLCAFFSVIHLDDIHLVRITLRDKAVPINLETRLCK